MSTSDQFSPQLLNATDDHDRWLEEILERDHRFRARLIRSLGEDKARGINLKDFKLQLEMARQATEGIVASNRRGQAKPRRRQPKTEN